MMGFVSSFAGATLRTPTALAGRAVAVAPASGARVARWSMVQSKSMPFMEAPAALDGTLAGGTLGCLGSARGGSVWHVLRVRCGQRVER